MVNADAVAGTMLRRFGPGAFSNTSTRFAERARSAANHSDSLGRTAKRGNKSYANSLHRREVGEEMPGREVKETDS